MEDVALAAGTQQNLSNQYSLDIYEPNRLFTTAAIFANVNAS